MDMRFAVGVIKMIYLQNIKEYRSQLYEDVWKEPMIALTAKYNLSDNGIRKRCKSLKIPIPPFGYWAKVKAGKTVSERPPLPPYEEIMLEIESYEEDELILPLKKNGGSLVLRELTALPINVLDKMSGLDLLTPSSLETFSEWCSSLSVPGRVQDFDDLISKHKAEVAYRIERDKEYPFHEGGIYLQNTDENVKHRNDESALPIFVSDGQQNRAYRIIDTIIKSLRQLKAKVCVDHNDKDNIHIEILRSSISFDMHECKTKRRHLTSSSTVQLFRPIYEEIYDGRLQIIWQLQRFGFHPDKPIPLCLKFIDQGENTLEKQIPTMIYDVYKNCCNSEIAYTLEGIKSSLRYEREDNERRAKELVEKQNKRSIELQARKAAFIKGISDHSSNWFKHEQLSKYADELEAYATTIKDQDKVRLLHEYISLVRENADEYSPINFILLEMGAIGKED